MTIDRSCGPEGCEVDWLVSPRIEADAEPALFQKFATDAGWGDGLPLIPPTEARVREYVAASGRFPDEHLGDLPPRNGRCTVEKVAINAAMTGAAPEAMPLVCSALEAMLEPEFNLFALNTTTCCVVPGVFVHGPCRNQLQLPYGAGCFGGAAGPAPAIGRAIRLVMRNVGGQVVGVSSKSVFGQPGRVAGIVVAEWEERSPWAPLGERRGVPGDAVTVKDVTGTIDIADVHATSGEELLEIIGRSLAFPGTNAYIDPSAADMEIMVAIAPPWADVIARSYPDVESVQEMLQRHARLPIDFWPEPHRRVLREGGRVAADGSVALVGSPEQMLVMVCGGLANLHALGLHTFGPTRSVTRAIG